jgi:hypothetical protein
MGYTWEHDIHLWMKRIWVVVSSWGDASEHYAAVLDSLASAGAGAGAGSGTAEGAGTGVG